MAENRKILFKMTAPDGRQAYIEEYGEGLVIGGDWPVDEAFVALAASVSEGNARLTKLEERLGDDQMARALSNSRGQGW